MFIPIAVFVRQLRQVRRGVRRKVRGIVLFFAYSMIPVLSYVAVFFLFVGIEELTKIAIISEGFSRTLLLVVGVWLAEILLLTAVFAIVVSFLRPAAGADHAAH